MNHTKEDTYLHAKRNQIKLYFRLRLGLHQLIFRPYNSIVLLLLIFLFLTLWKNKWLLFPFATVPVPLLSIYQYAISIAVIIIPIVFILGFLKFLGDITARHEEANLVVAFTAKDLRNGHPLLINRKTIKGTDVTIHEFYSNIPMKIWRERKEELADQMNVHFVSPEIEYGGKGNDNGKRIRLYTAPGRIKKSIEALYDNEF